MICDAHTCDACRYLEQDERMDERMASLGEFLVNCQQAKCKVVRLVRQQISKLQNMQYERSPIANKEVHEKMNEEMRNKISSETHEALGNEVNETYGELHEPYDKPYDELHGVEGEVKQAFDESDEGWKQIAIVNRTIGETNSKNTATASVHLAMSPERAVDRKWILRILDRVRHRAHLILAAAAVGVIVWTALVYGVFLGATACGNNRACFQSSSIKYTHVKRTLF